MVARFATARRGQRGAGLIETMVGILIGLIVVLVIYNMLSAAESYKRMAVGTSDAQITGLLSQFMVGREASNGGNGISISAPDLMTCDAAKASNVWPYTAGGGKPALWHPIPVLVQDGGANDVSDSFITLYSGSPHVVWPVSFTADAAPGQPFIVQSPNGFTSPSPAVTPYLTIGINSNTGDCEAITVTAATAADAFGRVTLTHSANAVTYEATIDPAAKLVNLGPVGIATRTLYENWDPATGNACANGAGGCQIYSTDLLTAGASRVPLAQNIVLMKVQYGLDLSNPIDGIVDCWTPAKADITVVANCNPPGLLVKDWTPASVRGVAQVELQRIVAVRIGLVVRSDEQGTRTESDSLDPDFANSPLKFSNRPGMVLFNCAANDATCLNRIVLKDPILPVGMPNVIQDGWRYRTFEAVIPLRNAIFNALP
ncbi:MAG TPA: PilW family protein [Casimicrobiaceae bacterium]|nr:PilW family protein [Casimicrobiaceae bacterium]